MIIDNLNSIHSHLFLYQDKDILFVWSKTTTSLYSFSNHYAALFFFMEENRDSELASKYLESIGLQSTTESQNIIETIYNLITNSEDHAEYKREKLTLVPKISLTMQNSKYKIYSLYNSFFSLYLDEDISSYIEPAFEHLISLDVSEKAQYHFEVQKSDNTYEIYANGVKQESVLNKENILPVLQDCIRIIFYENTPFIVAMHAAVLEYKNKTFIFPGVSGAGKSTLSSFLMHREFTLYSDEVTVVDDKFQIRNLALCNTVKENSWNVLKSFTDKIDSLEIHRRFDGQRIKFLKPLTLRGTPLNAVGSYMIFPTYKKSSQTTIKKLSIIQAIALIKEAQYHLYDPQELEIMKSFLIFLTSCKLYSIVYSDLESAKESIQGVLKDD